MHRTSVGRPVVVVVFGQLAFGLAFLVPEVLDDVSPVELSLGRYVVFGLVSLAVLAVIGPAARRTLTPQVWRAALVLGLAGNAGYYLLLVIGVQNVGAPVTALIIGALPVTMALLGSRDSGISARALLLPLALTVIGLVLVNVEALTSRPLDPGDGADRHQGSTLVGVLAALAALASWTAFGLANSRFMRRHPDLGTSAWTSALGVTSMLWTLPAAGAVAASAGGSSAARRPIAFLTGALVLGLLTSWLATAAWNHASAQLPVSLAGQLVVVETVSGTAYSYLHRAALPNAFVLLGGTLLIAGALIAIRRSAPPRHTRPAVNSQSARARPRVIP